MPKTIVSDAVKILGRVLPLCLAAVGVAGCAPDVEGDESVDDSEVKALQAPTSQTTLRNPDGVYFADVTANGTGCPAGTWQTSLSPDGQTFTTTFSAYETMVDSSKMFDIKDCQLAIKLHTPQGLSFSVTSFYYAGYALLEEGVKGLQTANYYFQGNPALASQVRTDLVGPHDNSYLFSDEVPISDVVWSPCGTVRDLNIMTRLRLQNSNPRRNGYMNLSAVDGSAKLVVKLAWRECTNPPPAAPADAGARDAGAADAGRDSGRRVR